jgi:microcystin-dependent protein
MSRHTQKIGRAIAAVAIVLVLVPGVPAPVRAQSTPFVGQLYYMAFNFAPKGYAFCNGQLEAISQNAALFSLLGTTYGGDGVRTFGLPNMQGRVPIHQGQGPGLNDYVLGQTGGSESVTLSVSNLPAHAHSVSVTAQVPASSAAATAAAPAGDNLANSVHTLNYSASAPNVSMGSTVSVSGTTGNTGGGQPFSIVQPYTVLTCVVALQGIFPSQN